MNLSNLKIIRKLKRLSKEQKRIIVAGAIALLLFVLCWFLIYRPEVKRFAEIQAKLHGIDNQISQVLSVTKGKQLTAAIKDLNVDLAQVTGKLPLTDQGIIYVISDIANKLKINVKTLTRGSEKILDDKISGYSIHELPITISFSCEYKTLGDFLINLREKSPVLVRIKQLDIVGSGFAQPNLEVTLQLSGYISLPKN